LENIFDGLNHPGVFHGKKELQSSFEQLGPSIRRFASNKVREWREIAGFANRGSEYWLPSTLNEFASRAQGVLPWKE
jgi:hypothetical protein